jgi:formate hydrogenlyase subunit 3/multisubunit Na+/H+ antiporter MnhD subunit
VRAARPGGRPVLGGIAFKLSLVPFHARTPTTYAGSPLPITVFLAGVSKAALAALLSSRRSPSSAEWLSSPSRFSRSPA